MCVQVSGMDPKGLPSRPPKRTLVVRLKKDVTLNERLDLMDMIRPMVDDNVSPPPCIPARAVGPNHDSAPHSVDAALGVLPRHSVDAALGVLGLRARPGWTTVMA